MKDSRLYLEDMLVEIDDVFAFTIEGKAAFLQSRLLQKGVIRSFEVLGEIAKRMTPDFRDNSPQIDWRRLIGFRDYLAHHYEQVIFDFVWTAVEDLPNLKAACLALLNNLDASSDPGQPSD